jgi:hypothetical protein
MEITLKNKCCLYVIIAIRFFSITIFNLHTDFHSYFVDRASRYNSGKWRTWRTILFSSMFISILYMFRAPRAHHQENQLYQYNIWHMSLCLGDRLVCRSTSNRHMSDTYCCLLANKQVAVPVWHMPVAVCTVLNSWWWTERPSEIYRVLSQK